MQWPYLLTHTDTLPSVSGGCSIQNQTLSRCTNKRQHVMSDGNAWNREQKLLVGDPAARASATAIDRRQCSRTRALKVLCVGLSRTGTSCMDARPGIDKGLLTWLNESTQASFD